MSHNSAEITVVKGTVELRKEEGNWKQVSKNTTMYLGDQLRKKPGATVQIKCGDGTSGEPFDDDMPMGLFDICPTIPRNGIEPKIPYIISPRDKRILSNKPTLRWNAAILAKTFTVTISNGELEWEKQVSREEVYKENSKLCELIYPGDPLLQPGVSYSLIIKTDTNHSSAEEIPLKFQLIEQDKAEELRTNSQRIEAEELSASEKALKLAELYVESDLFSEAIETLETLAKDEKSVTVYYRLGQLYGTIGLLLEAEVQYEKAVELAKAANDKLKLAASQTVLGELCRVLGKNEKAVNWLKDAKAEYVELRDAERVSEIEVLLVKIGQ